jgi:HSP20 family protein
MATQSPTPNRSRAIEPYRPGNPLFSFYRQANRLFGDVFREFEDTREALGGILAPSIDVTQDDRETRITAELPGVRQEDVDVSVDNDVLTIRAEKRVERSDGRESRHITERAYGTFQRALRLPQTIDPERVRAHFDSGVLTVTLPGTDGENGRRRVAIESGAPPEKAGDSASESRH